MNNNRHLRPGIVPGIPAGIKPLPKPVKMTLDSSGRMFDEKGKIITLDKHVELKVNKKGYGST